MAIFSHRGFDLLCAILVTVSLFSMAFTSPDSRTLHLHPAGSRDDLVRSEQHEDGSCSYVLTVPQSCSCNCHDEFETLIESYEQRLSNLEAFVNRLTAGVDGSTFSPSFQLFQSLSSSTESSVDYDVMVEEDLSVTEAQSEISSTTETSQKITTQVPPRQQTTEKFNEEIHPQGFDDSDEDDDTPTVPTSKDGDDGHDSGDREYTFPLVNLQMNTEARHDPVQDGMHIQVDGMSGSVIFDVPTSSEEMSSSTAEMEILPPIESVKELQTMYDVVFPDQPDFDPIPPSGIELSLAALNDETLRTTIIHEDGDEQNGKDVLNSPLHLLKPKKGKKTKTENVAESTEEEPRRQVPGLVEGMENAAGYAGEFNKPQWKKLENFLQATKNETQKRKRPTGLRREPSCQRDGCGCLRSRRRNESGIYYLPNPPLSGKRGVLVELYCDLESEDGGWTVIQRRQNGSANFYRNWHHYAHGFGYLDSSFWIGNRMLHAMTRRFNYEIRIEFTDWDGKFGFAEYDRFYVGTEEDNFRLSLGKFVAGNRGNAFSYHNGTFFSTYDRDNDRSPGQCAVLRQAGFWFKNCNRMNPNGRWIPFADATGLNGAVITWGTWSRHLYTYSMRDFRMMIRPTSPLDFA